MATEKVTYELSLRDLMSSGLADINKKLGAMENNLQGVQKTATKTSSSMGSFANTLAIVELVGNQSTYLFAKHEYP